MTRARRGVFALLALLGGALVDLRAGATRPRPVFMGLELCAQAANGELFCGSADDRTGVLTLETSEAAALWRPSACGACEALATPARETTLRNGSDSLPTCCIVTGQASPGPGTGLSVRVHQPVPGEDLAADSLAVGCPDTDGQFVNISVWLVVVPATMAQAGQVRSTADSRHTPVRPPSLPLLVSSMEGTPPSPPFPMLRCNVAPLGNSAARDSGQLSMMNGPPLANGVDRFHPLSTGIRVLKGRTTAVVDRGCAVRDPGQTAGAGTATLHIHWDDDGYWGLLPSEATPVALKQGAPACVFAVADTGSATLAPSPHWAARALAFPSLSANGRGATSLVNFVDGVWLEPELSRSGQAASMATGMTPDGPGRRVDLANATHSGIPTPPDQFESKPSVQDLSMLSRQWWLDALASAAASSQEGPTERAEVDSASPLQLHFAVRNAGWTASPPERVHVLVFSRLHNMSTPASVQSPNSSSFPAWYPHPERKELAKLDAAARAAARLPRDLGAGQAATDDWPVSGGSPADDTMAAAALVGAACPAWSAVEPFDPVWSFVPTSSDNATSAPRLVAGRAQFASMALRRFEDDWSAAAAGQPQPHHRILMLPPVPANSSLLMSIALTREDLRSVIGLSGHASADAGAWGTCFALARAANQQRPESGGTALLATVVVPHHRLEAAWRLSEPIPEPPPNWAPLIGGLLGTVAGVVALALGYRWAVTRHAALDLADERADEQRVLAQKAAAAAKQAQRRQWSKDHSLVPADERPKQPTKEMLQSEAARLEAGDKSLWRPMRASMPSMASGLMFNKRGELVGSVSKEGIVRDMSGARVGYIPGVCPGPANQAVAASQ